MNQILKMLLERRCLLLFPNKFKQNVKSKIGFFKLQRVKIQ